MAPAKLLGMVVDQSVQAVGKPEDFDLTGDIADARRRLFERVADRVGENKARRMIEQVERIRRERDIIDAAAREVEDE